jgi:hypothetical protein
MIKYWTPKFEKLNASIPSLSPKEEEWLKNELKSNEASRRFRVNNSTENYLRDVKRWTSMLQYLISNSETSTDKLSFLAYELSDPFMSDRISVLIERKVLDKNALPSEWTLFGLSTQALDRTRMHLVSFLSSCTIPNTLSNKAR